MPEVGQYEFTHHEVVAALIKQAGLHEGKWQLVVKFGFGAVNTGAGPGQVFPTAVVGVQSFGLIRAEPGSPPELVIDAAEINPAST